jgi:hypothetical protein
MLLQPFALVLVHLVSPHHAGRARCCSWWCPSSPSKHHGRDSPFSQLRDEAFGDFAAVKDSSFVVKDGEILLPAGPLGVRQGSRPAHDRGAGAAHLGPDLSGQ